MCGCFFFGFLFISIFEIYLFFVWFKLLMNLVLDLFLAYINTGVRKGNTGKFWFLLYNTDLELLTCYIEIDYIR